MRIFRQAKQQVSAVNSMYAQSKLSVYDSITFENNIRCNTIFISNIKIDIARGGGGEGSTSNFVYDN